MDILETDTELPDKKSENNKEKKQEKHKKTTPARRQLTAPEQLKKEISRINGSTRLQREIQLARQTLHDPLYNSTIKEFMDTINSPAWSEAIKASVESFQIQRTAIYESVHTALTYYNSNIDLINQQIADLTKAVHPSWKTIIEYHQEWERNNAVLLSNALQTHFSAIDHINSTVKAIAESINFENLFAQFRLEEVARFRIESNFINLTTSYKNIYSYFQNNEEFVLSSPPIVSEYPAASYFRTTNLIDGISSTENKSIIPKERKDIRPTLAIKKEQFITLLHEFGSYPLYSDTIEIYESNLNGRVRAICHNFRDLFTHVIYTLAPDNEIKDWSQDEKDYHNGRPTRRLRLKYIFKKFQNSPLLDFFELDMNSTLDLNDLLIKEAHILESKLNAEDLDSLREKIEYILFFLLAVAKSGY